MTDKTFAKEQYKRLAEFNGFHALTSEAIEDYLCAIQTGDTEAIGRRVIDDIKSEENREHMPSSAYIRRKMNDENDRGKPDPVLAEHEHWKAQAEADDFDAINSMSSGRGIWAKGKFPKLDRHLELLQMKVRLKGSMPEELQRELKRLTEELRFDKIGPHGAGPQLVKAREIA